MLLGGQPLLLRSKMLMFFSAHGASWPCSLLHPSIPIPRHSGMSTQRLEALSQQLDGVQEVAPPKKTSSNKRKAEGESAPHQLLAL